MNSTVSSQVIPFRAGDTLGSPNWRRGVSGPRPGVGVRLCGGHTSSATARARAGVCGGHTSSAKARARAGAAAAAGWGSAGSGRSRSRWRTRLCQHIQRINCLVWSNPAGGTHRRGKGALSRCVWSLRVTSELLVFVMCSTMRIYSTELRFWLLSPQPPTLGLTVRLVATQVPSFFVNCPLHGTAERSCTKSIQINQPTLEIAQRRLMYWLVAGAIPVVQSVS